jgi:hypothetical protein
VCVPFVHYPWAPCILHAHLIHISIFLFREESGFACMHVLMYYDGSRLRAPLTKVNFRILDTYF